MESILIALFWLLSGIIAAGLGIRLCGSPNAATIVGTIISGPFGFVMVFLAVLLSDKEIK